MSGAVFIEAGGLGRHSWWRSLAVFALAAAAAVAAAVTIQQILVPTLRPLIAEASPFMKSSVTAGLTGLIFLAALSALGLGTRWIHARPFRSLLTAAPRYRWGWMAAAFVVTAGFVTIFGLWRDPAALDRLDGLSLQAFAIGAALVFAGVAVQATTEEVLFRGWLTQVAFRAWRRPVLAMMTASVVFTVGHWGYGIESALFSLIFALGAGLVTLMTDGIELAAGAHVANNFIVVTLLSDITEANAPGPFDPWEIVGVVAAMSLLIGLALLMRRPRRNRGRLSPSAT